MELIGMFRRPRDREQIPAPRDTWRCKGCGWVNLFESVQPGRSLETKGLVARGKKIP
jgi:hypothetical protein